MSSSTAPEATFERALAQLRSVIPREEIELEEMSPPQRLAMFSHALVGVVYRDGEEIANGRLILLYEPDGHEAWSGCMRLVTYVTTDLEAELATDPLLAGVGWSWLADALDGQNARYTAIAGTVTQTLSTRFGELSGPAPAADIEIRASWTPLNEDVAIHLRAWCDLLACTAGLPPPGVAALAERWAR